MQLFPITVNFETVRTFNNLDFFQLDERPDAVYLTFGKYMVFSLPDGTRIIMGRSGSFKEIEDIVIANPADKVVLYKTNIPVYQRFVKCIPPK